MQLKQILQQSLLSLCFRWAVLIVCSVLVSRDSTARQIRMDCCTFVLWY